jgi:hypothetical protein
MDSTLEWRQIANVQSYQFSDYQLSESGIVFSSKRSVNRVLKPSVESSKTKIILSPNSHPAKKFNLHAVVAEVFIPNHRNCKFIIFKDGNSSNCHKDNLEWTDDPYLNDAQGLWEDMNNFSRYEICRSGFRNKTTKQPMNINYTHDYPKISLVNDINSESANLYVHILMAKQYISNPMNYPVVNHINGITDNFDIDNLEWGTYQDNTLHAVRTGLIGKTPEKVGAWKN